MKSNWDDQRRKLVEELELVSLQNVNLMRKLQECYLTIIKQSKVINDLNDQVLSQRGLSKRGFSVPVLREVPPIAGGRERLETIAKIDPQDFEQASPETLSQQLHDFENLITKKNKPLFDLFRTRVFEMRQKTELLGQEVD